MYIAETSPSQIRGTLISLKEFFIVLGMLVSFESQEWISNFSDCESSYFLPLMQFGYIFSSLYVDVVAGWRYMYATGAPVALVMGIGMWWLPPSPRWLLLCAIQGKGNISDLRTTAISCLCRVRGQAINDTASEEIDAIMYEISHDDQNRQATFFEIFQGKCLKALVIGVGLLFFQQVVALLYCFLYDLCLFLFWYYPVIQWSHAILSKPIIYSLMLGHRATKRFILCSKNSSGIPVFHFWDGLGADFFRCFWFGHFIPRVQSAGFSAASDATRVSVLLGLLKVYSFLVGLFFATTSWWKSVIFVAVVSLLIGVTNKLYRSYYLLGIMWGNFIACIGCLIGLCASFCIYAFAWTLLTYACAFFFWVSPYIDRECCASIKLLTSIHTWIKTILLAL